MATARHTRLRWISEEPLCALCAGPGSGDCAEHHGVRGVRLGHGGEALCAGGCQTHEGGAPVVLDGELSPLDEHLQQLAVDDMRSVEPRIDKSVFDVLSVDASVASRTSWGGTAPGNVRAQAETWRKKLQAEKVR